MRHTKVNAWTEWLDEFRRHSPEWAAQLAAARTRRELKDIVSHLAVKLVEQINAQENVQGSLRDQIRTFMAANLHRGLTLKDLSAFWGYSEKYCSELFLNVMGEPFSRSIKQLRVQKATRLLADSQTTIADIAGSLGFSDQFAFSHFFKRSTGRSPREFRTDRAQRRPLQKTRTPSHRGNR